MGLIHLKIQNAKSDANANAKPFSQLPSFPPSLSQEAVAFAISTAKQPYKDRLGDRSAQNSTTRQQSHSHSPFKP
jgi:hypothetical protein